MNLIVRRATLKDLPILMEFMSRLVEIEQTMDSSIKNGKIIYYDLRHIIQDNSSDLYVVQINKKLVASGYVKIKDNKPYLKHNQYGYLGFMYVLEKYRGNGYNKIIINTLLKWCKDRGINEVQLDVYNSNPYAIRAYEKVGFKKNMINMRMDIETLDF